MELTTGTYVVLKAKHSAGIWARRVPETIHSPRARREDDPLASKARIVVSEIPDDTLVLYVSSKRDAFKAAIANKGKGPYGWRPGDVVFHLVLWDGRPVWVSSDDATLERVSDAGAG